VKIASCLQFKTSKRMRSRTFRRVSASFGFPAKAAIIWGSSTTRRSKAGSIGLDICGTLPQSRDREAATNPYNFV
jgi:hypothetical protein